MTLTPEKKLTKSKINILLDHPFFGRTLLELMMVRDDTQPTGYTDGKVLGWNHDFIDAASLQRVDFFMCHEVLHVALMHHTRRGHRDPKRYNIAADHVINLMLKDCGYPFDIPDDVYMDDRYKGMSVDKVYDLLPKDAEGEGKGIGEVQDLKGADGKPATAGEKAQEEQRVKIVNQQGLQAAKAAGKMPAEIERIVGELLDPKVPWHEVLRDYVSTHAKDDYSWSRPNRRFSGSKVMMPALYSEKLGEVMIAVDTSGSLSQGDLTRIASEIQGVIDDFPSASATVLYCDYEMHTDATQHFDAGEDVVLKPKGGGGTRFKPVFDYIEEQEDPPVVLLYMTDLCGNLSSIPEPPYPVIWGLVDDYVKDPEVPFGTVCSLCD